MLTVLIKILGIFAIIVVGYIATKTNIITKESESSMVNLLILVTTPCMAFSSIVSKELDSSISEKIILVLLVSLAYFIIMPILVLPLGKIFTHTPKEDVGVLMAIMVAANAGFMGFPITKAIFGDHFFFLIVVQNIILNIYLFGIAVLQMNYGSESKFDIKSIIKSVMNPCVVVSLIAMVILFTGIKMPEPVMDITGMLGNVTTPLSMIIVGMRLANSKFDSVLKNRDLIIASLFNVLIAPLCAFLMVNWLPFLTDDVKLLIIWASAFPCAVIIAGLAAKEGRNATLVSEGIALTTLLSLITLPIAATILTSLYLH
ncbi:MAG: AEC family transporter [Firmicutes bacterium]|nr:AEC family transporter [Bacillota bacterium]